MVCRGFSFLSDRRNNQRSDRQKARHPRGADDGLFQDAPHYLSVFGETLAGGAIHGRSREAVMSQLWRYVYWFWERLSRGQFRSMTGLLIITI